MRVELIDHMGDDLRVANAARVSFAKESEWEHTTETRFDDNCMFGGMEYEAKIKRLSDKDTKLIHYLAKHGHWSPFSHCFLTFRIKAPIFVARQLQKHQVGLAWNEVSRRYVDNKPEFAFPVMRQRAENVKQGSSNEFPVNLEQCEQVYLYAQNVAEKSYEYLLSQNVAPEVARMVLPQSMMTEWYWSGSLYAFSRVCKQRLDSHAQKETREVAHEIAFHLAAQFPVSYQALTEN